MALGMGPVSARVTGQATVPATALEAASDTDPAVAWVRAAARDLATGLEVVSDTDPAVARARVPARDLGMVRELGQVQVPDSEAGLVAVWVPLTV
jgi:hypothetical protein